jgi:predicted GNAT family N-acyltransferase
VSAAALESGRLAVRPVAPGDLSYCLAVRRRVFIEGQGVPEEIEIDGRDAASIHFLATLDGRPVGTARLRAHQGAAKVERVAVLAEHRGSGIGHALMDAVEASARAQGFAVAVLHAQVPVADFYERLGYRREGSTFLEADIPHVRMTKPL